MTLSWSFCVKHLLLFTGNRSEGNMIITETYLNTLAYSASTATERDHREKISTSCLNLAHGLLAPSVDARTAAVLSTKKFWKSEAVMSGDAACFSLPISWSIDRHKRWGDDRWSSMDVRQWTSLQYRNNYIYFQICRISWNFSKWSEVRSLTASNNTV